MTVEKHLEMWLKNGLISAQMPIQFHGNLTANYYHGYVIEINLPLYLISLLNKYAINNSLDRGGDSYSFFKAQQIILIARQYLCGRH